MIKYSLERVFDIHLEFFFFFWHVCWCWSQPGTLCPSHPFAVPSISGGPDWRGVRSCVTDRWFIWVNLSLTGGKGGGERKDIEEDGRRGEVAKPLIHKDIGWSNLLMLEF